jgi:hypothetical protein
MNNNIRIGIATALVSMLAGACFWSDSPQARLANYLRDHASDFTKTVANREIALAVSYLPTDLVAHRNWSGKQSGVSFEAFKKEYDGLSFFELKITTPTPESGIKKRIQDDPDKEKIETYYNYQIGQDIRLVVGADTIPCAMAHRIQDGGLYDHLLITCAFEAAGLRDASNIGFVYSDRIFSQKNFFLPFESRKIIHTPAIKN